jgi:hypothetical protein
VYPKPRAIPKGAMAKIMMEKLHMSPTSHVEIRMMESNRLRLIMFSYLCLGGWLLAGIMARNGENSSIMLMYLGRIYFTKNLNPLKHSILINLKKVIMPSFPT